MITANGMLCLQESEIGPYLGNPSDRQLCYLRARKYLLFLIVNHARVYPIAWINKRILADKAEFYPFEAAIKFYSPPEAAAILQKSLSTINHYRTDGKGPRYFYFGKFVRYVESDLVEWMFAQISAAEKKGK